MIPLQGTLETVVLYCIHKGNTAIGTIKRNEDMSDQDTNNQDIFVVNGAQYWERRYYEVLVRTDTKMPGIETDEDIPTLRIQTGNFVSSEIPPQIQKSGGLDADAYLLIGVLPWEGYWPDLDDINKTFDPGRIGKAPYFIENNESGMWVSIHGPGLRVDSYEDALDRQLNLNPRRYSRVILVDSEKQIGPLEEIITQKGLVPIRMEPLQKIKNEMPLY